MTIISKHVLNKSCGFNKISILCPIQLLFVTWTVSETGQNDPMRHLAVQTLETKSRLRGWIHITASHSHYRPFIQTPGRKCYSPLELISLRL